MNPSTGEVSTFPTRAELEAVQANRRAQGLRPLIELGQLPNPSCPRCYGRGTVGRNLRTGDVVPCKCTRRHRIQRLRPGDVVNVNGGERFQVVPETR